MISVKGEKSKIINLYSSIAQIRKIFYITIQYKKRIITKPILNEIHLRG